jgi:phosphoglycolate phosphatase-like HAD superfamily hydrolase
MIKPILALDADGVLLDYSRAWANAWARFSGAHPVEKDPKAYWHFDRYDVPRLKGDRLLELRRCFNEEFWSSIHPLQGALEACNKLHDAGYELVCVTALDASFSTARLRNLRAHGFPIERVLATGNTPGDVSPKAAAIHALRPVAFADDYLPFFAGIKDVHTALILREPNGSPNVGPDLHAVGSQHADLLGFANWWLSTSVSQKDGQFALAP